MSKRKVPPDADVEMLRAEHRAFAAASRQRWAEVDAMSDDEVEAELVAVVIEDTGCSEVEARQELGFLPRPRAFRGGPERGAAAASAGAAPAPPVPAYRRPGSEAREFTVEFAVPTDPAEAVPVLAAAVEAVEALLADAARRAAEQGSWAAVGRSLGITRQSARQRFGGRR